MGLTVHFIGVQWPVHLASNYHGNYSTFELIQFIHILEIKLVSSGQQIVGADILKPLR